MNKIQTLIIAIGCSCLSWSANAQVVSEVVSIQPGYTNQVFYNMNSGELSNITHTDWDIAFQLRGFAARSSLIRRIMFDFGKQIKIFLNGQRCCLLTLLEL